MEARAADAAEHFALDGPLVAIQPLGAGHINDSYTVECRGLHGPARYVLQRLNRAVFAEPLQLMANVQRVTGHIAGRLQAAGAEDVERRVMALVPSTAGEPCHRDETGGVWRVFRFIEQAVVHHTVETPAQARQAALAFGRFQALLADLGPPRLFETIPRFHDTPHRCALFVAPCVSD